MKPMTKPSNIIEEFYNRWQLFIKQSHDECYNAGLEKAVEIAQSTYYESPDLKEDTDVVVTKIIAAIKKEMK
jgi:hypothetical protein